MTARQAGRLLAYWKRRLGLSHWNIRLELDAEFDPDTTDAHVRWDWSYDNATVRLAPRVRGYAPEKAESVIVHELLHLVLRDLEVAVSEAGVQLPKKARRHFRDRWHHESEGVVERLAVLLTELGGRS